MIAPTEPASTSLRAFAPLQLLWRREDAPTDDPPAGEARGDGMPRDLVDLYGGELRLPLRADRPTIAVNFVSTLDGVVALGPDEKSGGGEISGFYEPDRFVMALLRALADVVVVGAGTVRAAAGGEWTARQVDPRSAESTARWRKAMGLPPEPTTMVVTASGNVDLAHPGLSAPDVPTVIVTTGRGKRRLAAQTVPGNARVVAASDDEDVSPASVVELAHSLGASVVLCEGGPHLLGDFVAAGLWDDLFLTLAPQLVGRSEAEPRLALIEGVSLADDPARWLALESIRRSGDHLFLRYRAKLGGSD